MTALLDGVRHLWSTSSLFPAFMFPAWALLASGFKLWLHIRISGEL